MKWFKPTPPTDDQVLVANYREAIAAFNKASRALDAAGISAMCGVFSRWGGHQNGNYLHDGYTIKLLHARRTNTKTIYNER